MKKAAVIVPTYNPNQLNYDYILALKELHKLDFDIYVINNNSTNIEYLEKIKELDFVICEDSIYGGAYEAGALYQVFKKDLYETYMLVQDSVNIKSPLTFYNYASYHCSYVLGLMSFSSCLDAFTTSADRAWFDINFPDLIDSLKDAKGVLGNNFLCKRRHLIQMSKIGYFSENYLPKNKDQSQAWERVWGTFFYKYNVSVKFIDSVRPHMIDNYIFTKISQNRL
jgi:hypothetical protein